MTIPHLHRHCDAAPSSPKRKASTPSMTSTTAQAPNSPKLITVAMLGVISAVVICPSIPSLDAQSSSSLVTSTGANEVILLQKARDLQRGIVDRRMKPLAHPDDHGMSPEDFADTRSSQESSSSFTKATAQALIIKTEDIAKSGGDHAMLQRAMSALVSPKSHEKDKKIAGTRLAAMQVSHGSVSEASAQRAPNTPNTSLANVSKHVANDSSPSMTVSKRLPGDVIYKDGVNINADWMSEVPEYGKGSKSAGASQMVSFALSSLTFAALVVAIP